MVLVLGLGSGSVGTHPVLYILVPCLSPLANLCVLPVVLRARMRAVRSCRFDWAPFGDRAPRGAQTTRRACRRGSPYRMRGAPVVGRVRVRPARPFVRVWPVPPPRSPFVFVLSADALVVDLLGLLWGQPELGGCRLRVYVRWGCGSRACGGGGAHSSRFVLPLLSPLRLLRLLSL